MFLELERKLLQIELFSIVGPNVWNSLPNDVKSQKDVEHFKKSLKTRLLKLAFNVKF